MTPQIHKAEVIEDLIGLYEGVNFCAAKTIREHIAGLEAAMNEARKDSERKWAFARGLFWLIDEQASFKNGNTDPTGSIDEGEVLASRYLDRLDPELKKQARKELNAAIKQGGSLFKKPATAEAAKEGSQS